MLGALDDRSALLLDGRADGVRADDVFAIHESRRNFDVVEVASDRDSSNTVGELHVDQLLAKEPDLQLVAAEYVAHQQVM